MLYLIMLFYIDYSLIQRTNIILKATNITLYRLFYDSEDQYRWVRYMGAPNITLYRPTL